MSAQRIGRSAARCLRRVGCCSLLACSLNSARPHEHVCIFRNVIRNHSFVGLHPSPTALALLSNLNKISRSLTTSQRRTSAFTSCPTSASLSREPSAARRLLRPVDHRDSSRLRPDKPRSILMPPVRLRRHAQPRAARGLRLRGCVGCGFCVELASVSHRRSEAKVTEIRRPGTCRRRDASPCSCAPARTR